MAKVSSLAKEIRGIRHYFDHKYEDRTTARYESSLRHFNLPKMESITNSLFEVASDLGFIFKNTSYAVSDFAYSGEISDQIDLILFGGIKSAIFRFYEAADKEDFYWQAREKFFSSDALLTLLSK